MCVVCYEWAATSPGICGKCSPPLHDIANPEVLQMLHDEANRRLERDAALEVDHARDDGIGALLRFIAFAIARVRGKPTPTSARATLAARRQRDGVPVIMTHPDMTASSRPGMFEAPGVDPDTLDGPALVRWLGATLHD